MTNVFMALRTPPGAFARRPYLGGIMGVDDEQLVPFPQEVRDLHDLAREREIAQRALPFPAEEYAERLRRLRAALTEAGIDTLLLSRPESICWLTGYAARWYRHSGPAEWAGLITVAVRTDGDAIHHFDFAGEEDMIALTSVCTDVCILPESARTLEAFVDELRARGMVRGVVGREMRSCLPDHLTATVLEEAMRTEGAAVVDATGLVDRLLHIKSPAEIARVEEAVRICDLGVRAAQRAVAPGVTELEVWAEMMRAMVAAGGEPAALHEMVAAGPLFLPHIISRRRPIALGDLVMVDPCGVVDRYHGNVARTIVAGEPTDEQLAASRTAGELMAVFAAAVQPPAPLADVAATVRSRLQEAGLWESRYFFGGYDLGIAFPPDWVGAWYFDLDDTGPEKSFEPGMVTNLEAVAGAFAQVDTVVYEAGKARLLSAVPREILAAGA